MKTKLYHKDLGFPSKMRFPKGMVTLEYSRHALKAALDDRYGRFSLPRSINIDSCEVIEAETVNGALNKLVVRFSIDNERDICIVFMPRTKLVKTVWINVKGDTHKTLDKSKYIKVN